LACAVVALLTPSSRAQEAPADETAAATSAAPEAAEEVPTLEKIQEMYALWCETLDTAKRAQRKADAYQSSAASMPPGAGQITAQQNASQARTEADTNFATAGTLKKRVAELVEQFCAAEQAALDQATDDETRRQIEERMALAQELVDGGCS